jgi:dephospho-CoA kinase
MVQTNNLSQQPVVLADGTEMKYLIITAPSGVGKSTTGDYLEKFCGFSHIDGDYGQFNMHLPEYRKLMAGFGEVVA